MARLQDVWEASKGEPVPVGALKRSAKESGLDLLLAREEFGRAAGNVRSGVESVSGSGVDRRATGNILGGLALGGATAATFFIPGARVGRYAGGGVRGARVGALRAAAQIDSPRWFPEVSSGKALEASPFPRGGYPDVFEPTMLPNLNRVYTRSAEEVNPYYTMVHGERAAGEVWSSDSAANRLRFFHGTSNADNVESILSSGIRSSDNGQYGKGVYGSSALHEAIEYGSPRVGLSSSRYSKEAAEEARRAALEDRRYIFEFVTSPEKIDEIGRVGAPFGNVLVREAVEPDKIVAMHVFRPVQPNRNLPSGISVNQRWLLEDSVILKPQLRSAVEDFGIAPRLRAGRNVLDALEQDLKAAGLQTPSRQKLVDSFEPLGQMGREGGFTWDPRTGKNQFDSGYSVAVVKNYERPIPVTDFDSLKVAEYLRFVPDGESLSVAQRLAANPRNLVGAWVEPINGVDHVFLDVASVLPDRDAALRIGGAQGELGVFDFSSMKTLRLDDFPEFKPGGRKYDPDALARYGFRDAQEVSVGTGASSSVVPPSLLKGEGGFAADIPGERVRELAEGLAQRHLDSPQGLAAVPPQEIASVLQDLPEFADFVRMYRELVVGGMSGLDRRGLQSGRLNEFARRANLEAPRWARDTDTSLSFPASVSMTSSLPEAVRDGAVNLATRIRNMDVFVNDDIYNPTFYREFNRILNVVAKNTGMPPEVMSSALASASSQAAPYDEVLRFARISRMVRFADGRAEMVPGSRELLGKDNMGLTALRGFIDSINNPDFLTGRPAGQAMKTSAYAYNRFDPLYVPVYVADTVDGLGQFLIAGASPGTSDARFSIVNQIAGRTLASVYDVPPSAMQEATWSHIRVARDGLRLTPSGGPTQDAIAPAFTGAQGSIEDILVSAINEMDPRVVSLAKQNVDEFYRAVRSGDVAAWNWDAAAKRPTISSSEYLIPADQRPKVGGRAGKLQAQMMTMVESLGPELRARLMALTAATGIGLSVWLEALGDSVYDVPDSVFDGGRAGA